MKLTETERKLINGSSTSGYFQAFNSSRSGDELVTKGLAVKRGDRRYKLTDEGMRHKEK